MTAKDRIARPMVVAMNVHARKNKFMNIAFLG
jgi:hypothetical protein